MSSGLTKRILTTSHSIPSCARAAAACSDGATMSPIARTATSVPVRSVSAFADRQEHRNLFLSGHAEAVAARVAERDRAVAVLDGRVQHVPQFAFVLRRHDHHARDRAQVTQIEHAVMRRSVGSDNTRAVQREDHMEMLQRDVMDDLVERALQERRVDRNDRDASLRGKSRRQTSRRAAPQSRRHRTVRASPAATGPDRCRQAWRR